MLRYLAALALSLAAMSVTQGAARAVSVRVDLELVIAVDVSASMDAAEFLLQRRGYRDAIRHPDFLSAIRTGYYRRIAVTYVEWSGPRWQKVVVPWRLIEDRESAEAFAAALDGPPVVIARGTSISAAISAGAALIRSNAYEGDRMAIDVSGDGPNNYGRPVTEARDAAVAEGIVINGLPIVIAPSPTIADVARYYAECVIGGPGSFMLPIRTADEFAVAIRRKLILEVAGLSPGRIVPIAGAAPIDCRTGDKLREQTDQFLPGLDN